MTNLNTLLVFDERDYQKLSAEGKMDLLPKDINVLDSVGYECKVTKNGIRFSEKDQKHFILLGIENIEGLNGNSDVFRRYAVTVPGNLTVDVYCENKTGETTDIGSIMNMQYPADQALKAYETFSDLDSRRKILENISCSPLQNEGYRESLLQAVGRGIIPRNVHLGIETSDRKYLLKTI